MCMFFRPQEALGGGSEMGNGSLGSVCNLSKLAAKQRMLFSSLLTSQPSCSFGGQHPQFSCSAVGTLPFFLVSVSKPWLHWFGLEMLRLCGFSKQDIYCSLLCMQTQPTKKTQTKNKPARCFARALTESTWDTELASCLSNAIPVLKPVFKLYSNSHVQGCLCAIYIFLIKCSL